MRYYCTYFDRQYLTRGLSLFQSMEKCAADFTLFVLCMDNPAYSILLNLKLPGIVPISLEVFEQNDSALLSAKQNRTLIEYYFTCTPSLPLYIFNQYAHVDLLTYLDADLFFYADPEPLFTEIGNASIAIIEHRFTPKLQYLANDVGVFNVSWVTFRRDDQGLRCLHAWRNQCLEWCYDRIEYGRYGDQKYLDAWPEQFDRLAIIQHKGANLAPWNLGNYKVYQIGRNLFVDDHPLIFYHFQGLYQARWWLYHTNFPAYHTVPNFTVRRSLYAKYVAKISENDRQIKTNSNLYQAGSGRDRSTDEKLSHYLHAIQRIKSLFSYEYLFYLTPGIIIY